MQKPSLLADFVDIRRQIESDAGCNQETVRQRDRDIGLGIRTRQNDVATLRAWIAAIRQDRGGQGWLAQRGILTVLAALWLVGLTGGWLLGDVALTYDGSEPVNIIHALMILVGSQLVLLIALLTLLTFGLERVREAFAFINPAVWISRLLAWMQPARHPSIGELLDEQGAMTHYGIRRWLLVYLAQHFAVALNLGMIAVLFYLVTVTDLAFGWSTTLMVENQVVSGWFEALSSPWRWILPAAAPNADLVEASRFYRLQTRLNQDTVLVAELGTWWLFMLMCILFYGLLPRMLTLLYAGIRYDRSVISAIRDTVGAARVLLRMRAPLVTSGADEAEQVNGAEESPPPLRQRQTGRPLRTVAIEWSGVEADRAALPRSGITAEQFHAAGGNRSPDADRELIERIGGLDMEAVVLVAGSWEPPMMECIDFLRELRERMDASVICIVLLVPAEKGEAVRPRDLDTWESALYAMDDPLLYVEAQPP